MAARHQVNKLMRLANGICHYCKNACNYDSKKMYPTRDHIVPKGLGGPNRLGNYVLACSGCNHKRGTMLFYCKCQDCNEKIYDALYDSDSLSRAFDGIVAHNKPRVSRRNLVDCGRVGEPAWKVRIGHNQKVFYTFEEAVAFATKHSFAKDREYA